MHDQALKNKDNILNELSSQLGGGSTGADLTALLPKKKVSLSMHSDSSSMMDSFNANGKISIQYQFDIIAPHKENQVEKKDDEDDEGRVVLKNEVNVANDGDYIAAFILPPKISKKKKEQKVKSTEKTNEKMDELIQPTDISAYLDFNYVDESAADWYKLIPCALVCLLLLLLF
jgi:hypothetical protein